MKRIASIIIAALLATGTAFAAEKESITLGMEDGWGSYARADGTGMSPEIIKAAYDAVGIEVKFNVEPYARIVEEIDSGALLGGFNVAKQPSTEERFLFGKEPLFIAEAHFYVKKGNTIYKKGTKTPAEKPEDIGSKERVGLINGYEYGDAVEKNPDIVISKVNTQKQNLDKMLAPDPRVDAVVYFDNEANILFKEEIAAGRMKDGDVVPVVPSTPSIIYVAFSKKDAKSAHFAERLDAGLKIIHDNGTYKKIVDKY